MRRLLLPTLALTLALVVVSGAEAALSPAVAAGSETLSLRDGVGQVLIVARGAMLGRLEQGRLLVSARAPGEATEITVWGAERTVALDDRTTAYGGSRISFRIFGRGWRARIQGTGINVSAVVEGLVTLRGEAGMISVDGGPYRRWPAEVVTIRLGD